MFLQKQIHNLPLEMGCFLCGPCQDVMSRTVGSKKWVQRRGLCSQKAAAKFSAIEMWYERWNIKTNEANIQAIYVSHQLKLPEAHLTLKGRNIPFVNRVKYLVVIIDKRITWRLHRMMTEAKASRAFNRIYSVFESGHLSININLTLHKALIRSVMTYTCPAWELVADIYLLKL
jgi:hypothetical protein